jgi:hypothetical protein
LEDEDFLGPNYVAVRKTRSDIVDALRKHQAVTPGRLTVAGVKSVARS